jgi:hypothetical protein
MVGGTEIVKAVWASWLSCKCLLEFINRSLIISLLVKFHAFGIVVLRI